MVEEYSPAPISSRCGRASMFMMSRPFEKKTYRKICNLKIKCLPLQSQALTNGSIAQLVQSICLTSRGSGVRIPLLPLRRRLMIVFFCFIQFECRADDLLSSVIVLCQYPCASTRYCQKTIIRLRLALHYATSQFVWWQRLCSHNYGVEPI